MNLVLRISFFLCMVLFGGKSEKVSLICPYGWRVNSTITIKQVNVPNEDKVIARFCVACCPLEDCNGNVLVCFYSEENMEPDDMVFIMEPFCKSYVSKQRKLDICAESFSSSVGIELNFQTGHFRGFSVLDIVMLNDVRLQPLTEKHIGSDEHERVVDLICPVGFNFFGIHSKGIRKIISKDIVFNTYDVICTKSLASGYYLITMSLANKIKLDELLNITIKILGEFHSCDKNVWKNFFWVRQNINVHVKEKKCYVIQGQENEQVCGLISFKKLNYTKNQRLFFQPLFQDLILCKDVAQNENITLIMAMVIGLVLFLVGIAGVVTYFKCKNGSHAKAVTPHNPEPRRSLHKYETVEETQLDQDVQRDPLAYFYTAYDDHVYTSQHTDPDVISYVSNDDQVDFNMSTTSACTNEAGTAIECLSIILKKEKSFDTEGREMLLSGFKIGGGIDQDFMSSPQGYSDNGIYVTEIHEDSPAGRSDLRVHDKILQCNGYDFSVVTHKKAVDYIKKHPILNLMVARKDVPQLN